jgi:hypothetical protein
MIITCLWRRLRSFDLARLSGRRVIGLSAGVILSAGVLVWCFLSFAKRGYLPAVFRL